MDARWTSSSVVVVTSREGDEETVVVADDDWGRRMTTIARERASTAMRRAVEANARAVRRCERYERRRRALAHRTAALREDGTEEDARAARRAADSAREDAEAGKRRWEARCEALRSERDALVRARAREERLEAERLAPVLVGAREECDTLREEIEGSARRAESLASARDERARRAREVEDASERVRRALSSERAALEASVRAPSAMRGERDVAFAESIRARETAAAMDSELESFRSAENKAQSSLAGRENDVARACARVSELDARLATANASLHELEALLERESLTGDEIAGEGARREIDRSASEKRLTRAKQLNVRETRSAAQLDYRVDEVLTNESAVRQIIGDAEEVKSSLEREIASTASETSRVLEEQNALQIEIREQREMCKTAIAKSDLVAHTVSVSLRGEIADLEEEVKCLRREESVRSRIRTYVEDSVFRAMRRHHRIKHTVSALQSTLRIRETEIGDYESHIKRVREQQSHFVQLQEFTKTQSDAFAAVVKKSLVVAKTTNERQMRLESKVSDLEKHTRERDALVSAARAKTDARKLVRDRCRGQNDGVAHAIMSARADVEVSDTELGKLKDDLKAGKRQQSLLLEQSKTIIKSREAVAIELLDRNNELCQLCDRVATAEEVTRQCEEELGLRVVECEKLRRHVHDIERSLAIARQHADAVPEYQAKISSKRATLYEMQIAAENLSHQLEDPQEHTRWRLVHGPKGEEGNDIDVDDFNVKLSSVGARLEDKEHELAKYDLRCHDADKQIEYLRTTIAQNADEALEVASSLNRSKFQLSSIERQLLAIVSELAMYRALTASLANEKSRTIAEADMLRVHLEDQDLENGRSECAKSL